LRDVNADVPGGSITAVVGPLGVGKSTLLRTINRLIEPTAGEVYLDCKPTSEMNFLELRRRVGMVFQLPARNSMNTARHQLRSAALEW
jgi:ABC-type cobalamin/Fe3+-siderophores transport system ATPase subunit